MAKTKLQNAILKVNRSKEKLGDLQIAIDAFIKSEPYKFTVQRDSQTGQMLWRVSKCEEIPVSIPLLAGESIHDLRTALDYVAFELFAAKVYCSAASERDISFPVSTDSAKHKSKLAKIIKTSRNDVAQAFDTLEPYKGGRGHALWGINELDNISKHRMLLTAGVAIKAVDFRTEPPESVFAGMPPELYDVLRFSSLRIRPPCGFHLEADKVVFASSDNVKMDFAFAVAFNEVGVVRGEPILKILHNSANLVGHVIATFEAIL